MLRYSPEHEAYGRRRAAETWDLLIALPDGTERGAERWLEGRRAWIEANWPYYADHLIRQLVWIEGTIGADRAASGAIA